MDERMRWRPVVARAEGGTIRAYDPTGERAGQTAGEPAGELRPVAEFEVPAGEEVGSCAVAADFARAWFTTADGAACLAADGTVRWRAVFGPGRTHGHGPRPECALSADGAALWVYRPDATAGRGPDRWTVLDAATGAPLADAELSTVGAGAVLLPHPTDGSVLLNVGEGQDGSTVYRGVLRGGALELTEYPWDDRCLIDLSPDGERFLTVDHGQADLTVHDHPDGAARFTVTVEDFGPEAVAHEAVIEWSGGHLDADTLAVVLYGEDEDGAEWLRTHRVDARTGRVLGPFDAHLKDCDDLSPLGDGSWLTGHGSAHPVRRWPTV
ncbi:hypothetical protein ACIQBJ_15450 [Kitasatospora sp. NPDC088391]|uniref:hypothetical protein n=1 Tax=Kitasatospora sp. NPDC088391 TaxID=3364074 RepID=UPI0037FDD3E2